MKRCWAAIWKRFAWRSAEPVIPGLSSLTNESLTLFETRALTAKESAVNGGQTLLDKVNAPWDLSALFTGVYCADDNESARALSAHTNPYESVITPDGAWFGPGWVRISHTKDSKAGVLQRENELRQLKQRQEELQTEIAVFEDRWPLRKPS